MSKMKMFPQGIQELSCDTQTLLKPLPPLLLRSAIHIFYPFFFKFRKPLLVGLGTATFIFLGTNIACAVIVKKYQARSDTTPAAVSMVRVVINDTLFIVCGLVLSFCIYKISKTTSASMVLEAKVSYTYSITYMRRIMYFYHL